MNDDDLIAQYLAATGVTQCKDGRAAGTTRDEQQLGVSVNPKSKKTYAEQVKNQKHRVRRFRKRATGHIKRM